MNKQIKEKWVAALRSGEYKQGKNNLRSVDNTFCCLGVLCDIYQKETGIGTWEEKFNSVDFKGKTSFSPALLPEEVVDWAELKEKNPIVNSTGLQRARLSYFNDIANFNFNEIADLIEKSL